MNAGLPIWPVSYGGSWTNWLAERAEAAGRLVERPRWESTWCHLPRPDIYDGPPAIPVLIYRRPALAYASQVDRGLVGINLAKLGGRVGNESDQHAFDRLAAAQMAAWMKHPQAMLVRFEALADSTVRTMLEGRLGLPFGHLDTWRAPRDRDCDDWMFPAATATWLAMPHFVAGVPL